MYEMLTFSTVRAHMFQFFGMHPLNMSIEALTGFGTKITLIALVPLLRGMGTLQMVPKSFSIAVTLVTLITLVRFTCLLLWDIGIIT